MLVECLPAKRKMCLGLSVSSKKLTAQMLVVQCVKSVGALDLGIPLLDLHVSIELQVSVHLERAVEDVRLV